MVRCILCSNKGHLGDSPMGLPSGLYKTGCQVFWVHITIFFTWLFWVIFSMPQVKIFHVLDLPFIF